MKTTSNEMKKQSADLEVRNFCIYILCNLENNVLA